MYDYLGVFSFSLKPSDFQPSGSFNFSCVQDCIMTIKNISPPIENIGDNIDNTYKENRVMNIYAVNYNILKIISGMGALSYVS